MSAKHTSRINTMNDKDTINTEYRKQYYRDNLEKKREDARKYYHRNKEVLNANKRELTAIKKAAALAEKLRTEGVITEVPSKPKRELTRTKSIETLKAERSSDTYNMYQIAKIIGITYSKLRARVAVNPRYMMPKHMYVMLDGSKIFNKKEIDDWLPYIVELIAFDPSSHKKSRITISGNAILIIEFMRRNIKVERYCDEIRRKQLIDGRINNGQGR
jgi:hypothetical protein